MLYNWTPEVCLDMPATRFFVLLKHGRQKRAHERMEQCDIAAIAIMRFEYYEEVRGRYARIITMAPLEFEKTVGADPADAKDAILGMFASQKRALGYG